MSALANNASACMFYQKSLSADFHARKVLYASKISERLIGNPAEVVQANPNLLSNRFLPKHRSRMMARELEGHRGAVRPPRSVAPCD